MLSGHSSQQRTSREGQKKDFPGSVFWGELLLFLKMLLGSSSFSSSSLRHHKPKSLSWEVLVGFFMVWFPNLGRSPQAPILAPTLLPSSKHKVVSISSTHSACGGVPWSPSCPFFGLSVSPAPWSHPRARMGHPNLAGFVVKRSF